MTAHLYVLSGPDVGRSFEVQPGDTIGRSPDCIITVRDPSVSRKHAHLERTDGVWYVVDDGARNGVTVAGTKQQRASIGDMDEFSLGELLLRFREEAPALPPPAPVTPPPAAPAAPPAPAAPVSAPPALPAPGPEDAGLDLEDPDEIELAPATAARETAASLARTTMAPSPLAKAPGGAGERVLQYHRVQAAGGFSTSDLGQYPLWVRALVLLLGAALMAAIAFLAFRGTSFVKEKTGAGAAVEEG